MKNGVPTFAVVTGAQVKEVLEGRHREVTGLVDGAYRLHAAGRTVNPPSYFLRFPDRPTARIIALPASLGGAVDGIKWISSFPENVRGGLPRASAVLVLNDPRTGYPIACLESSVISAVRTAASAALAADVLSRGRERPRRIGFVGAGLIARFTHEYLRGNGWDFAEVGINDLVEGHAEGFRDYLRRSGSAPAVIHDSAEKLVRSSDLVVFATVAGTPHVHDLSWFAHRPLVLHLSLRDLSPEIIRGSVNVVDDIEHCLKAETSVHLTEQLTGGRDFLAGTLHDFMDGRDLPDSAGPVVFSPFGLGVLDLAVGKYVYDELVASEKLKFIDNFFSELDRYGKVD